ncbi:cerebellar degeneration-related protein 2-like [Saccoglossus kowalevskii]|uniref:Cerebellar degeneration-related protein 2-like n=1 Tax=Saccoglossus kowalevskii TaxID=10224 RepID=A0ABM0GSD6_SACKO|nr:PREDICTED: cerebellar degeneration-related protein 2-like [Saccoglossus kowalevskii]
MWTSRPNIDIMMVPTEQQFDGCSPSDSEHDGDEDGIVHLHDDSGILKSGCDEEWYSNDLQLAAELGKTLLERNRELESQLIHAQHLNEEHSLHIMHLEKQVALLREAADSKAKLYEQLDYNVQEMEKTSIKQTHELRTSKQKIERLTEIIESLENKVQEQNTLLEDMKVHERERARERRKTQSLPREVNLSQLRRYFSTSNLEETDAVKDEINRLKHTLQFLRSRLNAEKRRSDEFEIEISVLTQENQSLYEHMKELEIKSEENSLEYELAAASPGAQKSPSLCSCCLKKFSLIRQKSQDEDSDLPADSSFDEDGDTFEWDTFFLSHPISGTAVKQESSEMSLFGELDAQYHDLKEKYNDLLVHSKSTVDGDVTASVDTKCDNVCNTAVQTTPMLEKRRSLSFEFAKMKEKESAANEKLTEKFQPEYKKLFKEIFEVLRRSKKLRIEKK